MRWLIASFVAILGLVAILEWSAARLDAVSTSNKGGRKPTTWVALDGVEYRPTEEVSPPDRGSGWTHRASVEACDPVSGRRLWKVTIREGTWSEGMPGLLDPPVSPHAQFLAGFALKLAVRGRSVFVTTPDGGMYLIDPETRQVRQITAPSPPKAPVLDARVRGVTRCEVHDRSLREDVVPIRYGLGLVDRGSYEVRKGRFPHATSSHGGGCVVGESREARVLYCPDCREAEREWTREPPVEPADDGDCPSRLD
jgi:hypothetical protein